MNIAAIDRIELTSLEHTHYLNHHGNDYHVLDNYRDILRNAPLAKVVIHLATPEFPEHGYVLCRTDQNCLAKLDYFESIDAQETSASYKVLDVKLSDTHWGLVAEGDMQRDAAHEVFFYYLTLCHLMLFGGDKYELQHEEVTYHPPGSKKGKKKPKKRKTYFFRPVNNENHQDSGKHWKVGHRFNVRGHYRHYKNGKVVWVREHQRGEGEFRAKNYMFNNPAIA